MKLPSFLRHFFVPSEKNNFRAKALHISTLTYYVLFLLISSVIIKTIHNSNNVLGYATDITATKLFELTNDQRAANGVPPLAYSPILAQAAQAKAKDMFAKDYWAHFGPNGETPWQFIIGAGYSYEYAGENLAKNFPFSQDVVTAWMNSPSHRENMLRKEYTDVGFAVQNGILQGEETTLVVQMFGKPLNTQARENSLIPQAQAETKVIQAAVISPTPVVATVSAQTQPIPQNKPKVNVFPFYLNLNILFLVIFLIALVYDFYIAAHMGIIRFTGKNIAHFIFISFIIIATFVIIKGAIL